MVYFFDPVPGPFVRNSESSKQRAETGLVPGISMPIARSHEAQLAHVYLDKSISAHSPNVRHSNVASAAEALARSRPTNSLPDAKWHCLGAYYLCRASLDVENTECAGNTSRETQVLWWWSCGRRRCCDTNPRVPMRMLLVS